MTDAKPRTVNLRPKRGLDLPLEDGSPWPKEGKEVELTRYVRRRIADGDLVEAEVQAEPAAAAAAAAPEDGGAAAAGQPKDSGRSGGRHGGK